ncbi:RICIN domain-containing protein, partial [Streptomyces sp. NPDC001514]
MSEQPGRPSWVSPPQSEAATAARPLPEEAETEQPRSQSATAAEEGPARTAASTSAPITTATAAQPDVERASGTGQEATPDRQSRGRAESVTQTMSAGYGGPPEPNGVLTRPRKPILAGTAIAGAVLLALPLLMLGSGDKQDKAAPAGAAVTDTGDPGTGDTVLGGSGEDSSGGGAFVAASPTATASPTPPPSPSSKSPQSKSTRPAAAATTQDAKKPAPSSAPQQRALAPNSKVSSPALDLTNILLKNASTGLCADIPGTGKGRLDQPVQQAACVTGTGDNQMWSLTKGNSKTTGPGGTTLYVVKNLKDGLCLDVPGYGALGATQVVSEYSCNLTTADNQLWWLDKRANNTY